MTVRINHRDGRRQFSIGQVVIGNDDIDAKLARMLDNRICANACIYADDERDAFGCRTIDYLRSHSVTIAHAMRNKKF